MKIDLTEIPKIWITTDEGTKRHEAMKKMFQKVRFNRCVKYSAPRMGSRGTKEGNIGCTSGHLGANKLAEEFMNNENTPVLVFEDDVEPTKWFWDEENNTYAYTPVIEVPDDADAVYVGTSSWAQHGFKAYGESAEWKYPTGGPVRQKDQHGFVGSRNRSDIIRITNMTSLHALIYINPEYLLECRKYQEMTIKNGWWYDATHAQQLKNWNVYATTYPYFYQDDGEELIEATNCSITEFMESGENWLTSKDILMESERRNEIKWEKKTLKKHGYDMVAARKEAEKNKDYRDGDSPRIWKKYEDVDGYNPQTTVENNEGNHRQKESAQGFKQT